ncbi:MAG: cation-transporting P-type ATPase, partial [Promethearchaeota archaeon]
MAKKTQVVYEAQPDEPYFLDSGDAVLAKINSGLSGLTNDEAKARLGRYGPNELAAGKKKPKWLVFLEQFNDFLIYILIAGALISVSVEIYEKIAHDTPIRGTDAIVIFAIIIANAIIGDIQEGKADAAIEALRAAAA